MALPKAKELVLFQLSRNTFIVLSSINMQASTTSVNTRISRSMYFYVTLTFTFNCRHQRHSMILVPLDTPGVRKVRALEVFGNVGKYNVCVFFVFFLFFCFYSTVRLAPSLEWSWGATKSCASSETGKLCIESYFGVSILVTAVIAAIIGHSELLITQPSHEHFHVSRMNRWTAIWPMFVMEYFLQFQGNWKWLSLQSVRVHLRDLVSA